MIGLGMPLRLSSAAVSNADYASTALSHSGLWTGEPECGMSIPMEEYWTRCARAADTPPVDDSKR